MNFNRLITTDEAIQQFNISKHFIARHAKLMGNFSRPRRLDPKKIQAVIDMVSNEKQSKVYQKEQHRIRTKEIVEETLREVMGSTSSSLLNGRVSKPCHSFGDKQ